MYVLRVKKQKIWLSRENQLNSVTPNKDKALTFTWRTAAERFIKNTGCMEPFHKDSFKINKL